MPKDHSLILLEPSFIDGEVLFRLLFFESFLLMSLISGGILEPLGLPVSCVVVSVPLLLQRRCNPILCSAQCSSVSFLAIRWCCVCPFVDLLHVLLKYRVEFSTFTLAFVAATSGAAVRR